MGDLVCNVSIKVHGMGRLGRDRAFVPVADEFWGKHDSVTDSNSSINCATS